METIRFIHCADLHLDRPFETSKLPDIVLAKLKNSAYESFERTIDYAIEYQVDFVVISGDLFDLEYRSIKGQLFVKKQAERLHESRIFLYIIHGNHDPLTDTVSEITMPENVVVYSTETKSVLHKKNEKPIARIYGFSYPARSVTENKIDSYIEVKEQDDVFHVAMLHGQEQSQKDHDPYAPFTLKELKESGFDYWALGHIHKRQVLSEDPYIVYPGNIQGGHRKETGPKGSYLVELKKGDESLTFLPTSPIEWHEVDVSISELSTVDQLLQVCEQKMIQVLSPGKSGLFHLTFSGEGPLHEQLAKRHAPEELLEELRGDEAAFYNAFQWVDHLSIQTRPAFNREHAKQQDDVLGDMLRIIDTFEVDMKEGKLTELYNHRTARRYLSSLSPEEQKEIINEAERWLVHRLGNEVEG
ncbi:metallophosphoesterase family protein [Alteribacter populi]|uniref:metallophosphoesterase family protein n=1 Tax=Alteribacter populi TaxID=2011011 RepID=UPI0012FF8B28|nr:DNA repair exonuclease [Alteribacter populi]